MQIESRFGDIARAVSRSDMGVRNTAEEVARDIKRTMRPGRSAPGSAPGIDTGAYQASIEVVGSSKEIGIATDLKDQALALEFGTETMAARPHIRPAIQRAGFETIAKALRSLL